MLRITKLADAEYLINQVALGIDDYYLGIGEAPGVWQGRLADELGLSGVVNADELRALLLGRRPGTDEALLGGHRERRVAAFDVTFSAPKSVSLLWAFARPESRQWRRSPIPAPQLTENRRQLEEAERQALAAYRAGHIAFSQAIRSRRGWEHDLALPTPHGKPWPTRSPPTSPPTAPTVWRPWPSLTPTAKTSPIASATVSAPPDTFTAPNSPGLPGTTGNARTPPAIASSSTAPSHRRTASPQRFGPHRHRRRRQRPASRRRLGPHPLSPPPIRRGPPGRRKPQRVHAWARTVDGIQGGTWAQVHLLGTAALERFTGYTGQSRSRWATHTWNVTRLPDVDLGGVLADQRSPDREVLDALLQAPDTGFAAHNDPQRIQRLLAEQAEHQAVLAGAPPDRRRELRRAEDELRSAQEEHHWAKYRLDTAHDRHARFGPLSLLRRHGRHEKSATLDDIERFDGDVARAAGKVAGCRQSRDRLSDQVAKGDAWHVAHDWRYGRLASIEAELADLGHIDLRRNPIARTISRFGT
jgi:hypothetical protein